MELEQHLALPNSTQSDAEDAAVKQKPSVLLVEDDRSVRRYLEVTLQRAGYKVVTAVDGVEAMKHALASPIDIVVTDAIMPQLSGQELARFLRSNPKTSHLPIVLLTGQDNREAVGASDNLIDAFLYKPIRAEELRTCVAKLVQKSELCHDQPI